MITNSFVDGVIWAVAQLTTMHRDNTTAIDILYESDIPIWELRHAQSKTGFRECEMKGIIDACEFRRNKNKKQ